MSFLIFGNDYDYVNVMDLNRPNDGMAVELNRVPHQADWGWLSPLDVQNLEILFGLYILHIIRKNNHNSCYLQ